MPTLALIPRPLQSRRFLALSWLVLGSTTPTASWIVLPSFSRCCRFYSMAPQTRRQKVASVSDVNEPSLVFRQFSTALQDSASNDGDGNNEKKSPRKRKTRASAAVKTEEQVDVVTPTKKKKTKRTASPKKSPSTPRKAPKDWEEIYSLVEELRTDRSAPVDSDGGHALPQKDLGESVWRFQILIALMLSSQTKDAVVGQTMAKLQEHGLTMQNIQQTSHEQLNQLIGKVGFHNNKTKYIKQAVEICMEKYSGEIPDNAKELMELPGVGPKMAYIVECVAFGKSTGIGVDTHMHRMYNQLKWVDSKNPEQTRVQLQSWLPESKWPTVNVLWVGLGQEVQQFKPKILRKSLDCSRPRDALRLLKRLGMNVKKEAEKQGWEEEVKDVMKGASVKQEEDRSVLEAYE